MKDKHINPVQGSSLTWFYLTLLVFVLSSGFFIANQWYYILALPLGLWVAFLLISNMRFVFWGIVATLPLSVLADTPLGASFALPTEPLMVGLMLIFWIKVLIEGRYELKALRHRTSMLVMAHVGWMFITILPSSMHQVSFKFWVANCWFITCFYFLAIVVFKDRFRHFQTFFWLYIIPFAGVIVYSLIRHVGAGLTQKATGWVTQPFVIDHGVYGAMLGLVIPFLAIYFAYFRLFTRKPLIGVISLLLLILFFTGLIFSYTRAAWLGVALALVFYFVLRLRIRFSTLMIGFSTCVILGFSLQNEILTKLNRNKTDSNTDMSAHLKSVSNVRTDASNLERLNRWSSGLRMFKQRPFWGWGPGTYQFQYAQFQKPNEKTIISTNMHDVGGIHSEYFGPLVEYGIFGFLIFGALVGSILYTGMRVYYKAHDVRVRLMALMAVLGLVTYFTHGLMNNYLDSDKTAPLVWGFAAILTSLECFYIDKTLPLPKKTNEYPWRSF